MIVVYLDIPETILLRSNDRSFHALYHIMKQMNVEENKWYADKVNKKMICDALSITPAALEKMLASLKERNLLFTYHRGLYGLSSEIFTI
jgi:DNA-binding MarR family transcriptional regulator